MSDGTEKLCQAVYGRTATAEDYIGGSMANMLFDGATKIEALGTENEDVKKANEKLIELAVIDAKEIGSYRCGTGLRGDFRQLSAENEALGAENEEHIAAYQRVSAECRELAATIVLFSKDRAALRTLLKVAKCPNEGCVDGGVPVQVAEDEWQQEQCQWCDEREKLNGFST